MKNKTFIGVDIGGTKICIGKVRDGKIENEVSLSTPSTESAENVLRDIVFGIQQMMDDEVEGIGIGVPGLVDEENGIVYGVQNIPSWDKVHLRRHIEDQFNRKVFITNDANCFAIGEKIYGKGRNFENFVGLTIGTGLGAGIIINGGLYSGSLSSAGEFGGIPYLQYDFEHYCSNKFFKHFYNLQGHEVYEMAIEGSRQAISIFEQFAKHISSAIQVILYSLGPQAIILGGSVSKSFSFIQESLWIDLQKFPHKKIIEQLSIEVSETEKVAVLGAAALFQVKNTKQPKKASSLEFH
jgi:glucokinase